MAEHKTLISGKKGIEPGMWLTKQQEDIQNHILPKKDTSDPMKTYYSDQKDELSKDEQRAIADAHKKRIQESDDKFAEILRQEKIDALEISKEKNDKYTERVLADWKDTVHRSEKQKKRRSIIYRDRHSGSIIIEKY